MDIKEIVVEGRDLDETIDRGLLQISKSKEEVEIEVVEKEKSFFGKQGPGKPGYGGGHKGEHKLWGGNPRHDQ